MIEQRIRFRRVTLVSLILCPDERSLLRHVRSRGRVTKRI